ncbi:hypothetical protein AKH00_11295 [Microbacterium sp. GCS4]|nr:hypothetical protein AKH00_11295 [Microbacterium sp. GCS4]
MYTPAGYSEAPPAPPAYDAGPPVPPASAPAGFPAPGAPTPQAAPPGAYQVPVGGYAPSPGGYQVPEVPARKSGFLGILALVLAIVAGVVVPIVAGVAGFEIGVRIPSGIDTNDPELLSTLSPARDQVLWAEIAFWAGTVLGIAAIVIGILGIVRRQGRGAGIAALVVAAIAPVIFWVVLVVTIATGTASGFLPAT